MAKLIDMTGMRFGRLTVIRRAGTYVFPSEPKSTLATWTCLCDCGKEVEVIGTNLRRGNTQSCGCWRAEFGREKLERYKAQRRTNKWARRNSQFAL